MTAALPRFIPAAQIHAAYSGYVYVGVACAFKFLHNALESRAYDGGASTLVQRPSRSLWKHHLNSYCL